MQADTLNMKPSDQPEQAVASLLNAGFCLHQQGLLDQAESFYQEILKSEPLQVEALSLLATLKLQRKEFEACIDLFDQAIAVDPKHLNSLNNRAIALRNLNRLEEAISSYAQAIAAKPDYLEALYNCGNLLRAMNRPDEALNHYQRALKIKPDYVEVLNNRGMVLHDLNRLDEALESFDLAIRIKADYAEAFNNRGSVLQALNRLDEALASYRQAVKIKPDQIDALNNMGVLLQSIGRLDEALESYDRALQFDPSKLDLYLNRGTALRTLGRLKEALENYYIALKIKPDYPQALFNLANLLCDLKRHSEAIEKYDQALALDDQVDALYNRGNALLYLNRLDEALADFERVIKIKPDADFLWGIWLHTRLQICDWHEIERDCARLPAKVGENQKATPPFQMLALSDSPALQRKVSECYARAKYPSLQSASRPPKCLNHPKIRIGYFSADFHRHATAYLMASLFEMHDKSKFELYAFSFGPDIQDDMRERLISSFDRFIDVTLQSDSEIVDLARQLEIDIAVDLKGYTQDNRTGLFARRAAPIQVNYLGYPGTMGADYMDYLIADATLIPASDQKHYSEKIIYLPDSYQANDDKRETATRTFTREALGLPSNGFVFCCFNNSYKITPGRFDLWMHLLKRIEGSVLWLLEDNAWAVANLKKEARARGVHADRLVFAERMHLADHLARHAMADLFLDTSPYNAHTTASDALWAGLPVLTCIGQSFAGRVAASLLKAIQMPELIVSSPEAYQALAIDLATCPAQLNEIKQKLANNRLSTPLFNSRLFTQNIEAAYAKMYADQRSLSMHEILEDA